LNDGTAGLRRNVTSASDAMAARRYQTFNDLIEQTPHGAVHCAMVTGSCPNGLMGAIPASALDPIFYAHHTNIDRLYECWLSADEAGRLPTDPTELATEFTFIDADGSTAKRRVRDMLRLSQLGYSYSNCPARPAMVAAAGVQRVAQASDESLESAVAGITLAGPTRLAAGVTRVPINLPETQRERVTAEAAPSTDRRALIVIDGLKFDANPNTLYNVYLSDDTGRREPIGVISFFNFTAPQTGERAAHAAHSGQFKLDATRALQALAADSAATPSLIFEPTTGLTDSSPADAGASAAATVNQGANVRFDSARLVITD
jgi:hypothetical protein